MKKLKSLFLFLAFILLCSTTTAYSNAELIQKSDSVTQNPKIGLTLSGGGARGFAHIGVLLVLDSLGIEVDYISGTSMGAIIGGAYASGYSAKEIEEIILEINWGEVFNPKPDIEFVHLKNRKEAGKYIAEIPLFDRKIQMKSGIIEGQKLWNFLEEAFFHVRDIDDFSNLPIPFICIGTDIETGEAVEIDSGDLVSAIRASMAIPAVFTPVEISGKKLIDGGIANNFPVGVAKNMGADFVIGSYVSPGLRKSNQINNPVDMLYQISFYKDAILLSENRAKTALYIEPDLEGFTTSSFSMIKEMIEKGKLAALAKIDELNLLPKGKKKEGVIKKEKITINTVYLEGLKTVSKGYVQNLIKLNSGDSVCACDLTRIISRLYATGYFERITYNYSKSNVNPKKKDIVIQFMEFPSVKVNTAIHFNLFTGAGIIGGISTNKLLLNSIDAQAKIRVGQHPAAYSEINIMPVNLQKTWLSFNNFTNIFNFSLYEDYEPIAEYQQIYVRSEGSFNQLLGGYSYLSIGSAFYYQKVEPVIKNNFYIDGRNSYFQAFANWNIYSVDRHAFSRRGQDLCVEVSYFFNQKPSLDIFFEDDTPATLSDMNIKINNFYQFKLNWQQFFPFGKTVTLIPQVQAGYNYDYTQGFLNMFNVGGSFPVLKNQITFTGLNEYEIMSSSVVATALASRFVLGSDFYLTPVVNAALIDFDVEEYLEINIDNVIYGGGLNLGYSSLIGPIKITFAYSQQARRFLGHVNFGWNF